MFLNRIHAGHLLAERLFSYKQRNPLVLALPRGGVPVAYEVARTLEAPLDVLIVRRLSFPRAPEVAMGAVVAGVNEVFLNTELFGTEKVTAHQLQDPDCLAPNRQ
jgi:putative phosphoribosyl transferase